MLAGSPGGFAPGGWRAVTRGGWRAVPRGVAGGSPGGTRRFPGEGGRFTGEPRGGFPGVWRAVPRKGAVEWVGAAAPFVPTRFFGSKLFGVKSGSRQTMV